MTAHTKKNSLKGLPCESEAGQLEDLLERVANLLSSQRRQHAGEHDLKDVQLRALDYLAQCNRYSDGPLALAEFLGLTKGTVSQTVAALQSKGFVTKQKDTDDKRVVHLKLTRLGQTAVGQSFPVPMLRDATAQLSKQSRGALTASLRELLSALQTVGNNATFGACHSCRHLLREGHAYRCGLTQEPLAVQETRLICREHEP